MSLHPQPIGDIPEETQRVARAAFPKGTLYMTMRDELGTFFQDEDFAALFPSRGQSAVSPWHLALVTVMQFAENLTDRQAADAVRSRIDWKYALGLELTDAGFDFSVLSEFRSRLIAHESEQQLLDAMLKRFQEKGLLKARGRQRTDATHVLSRTRDLTRIELAGETMRQALNTLATVAPAWLKAHVPVEWFERYGKPFSDYRMPKTEAEQQALVETIGQDGYQLWQWIAESEDQDWMRQIPAVETLRQVWVQQFYIEADQIRWRKKTELPPSKVSIYTPYDPDARHSRKRDTTWVGYKVHLTETCDDDRPNLVVQVETRIAPEFDIDALETIYADLENHQLLPAEHFVDTGYTSSDVLVTSHQRGIDLVGPVRLDNSAQAKAGLGFGLSAFSIDWENKTVTCPMGMQNTTWREGTGRRGKPNVQAAFKYDDCQSCSARTLCVLSKVQRKRQLTFQHQSQQQALQAARKRQETEGFKERYKRRAGIEGTISQAVNTLDLRQARYRGHEKVHLEHVLIAAGMNLLRSVAWLMEVPRSQTRSSRFAKLAA